MPFYHLSWSINSMFRLLTDFGTNWLLPWQRSPLLLASARKMSRHAKSQPSLNEGLRNLQSRTLWVAKTVVKYGVIMYVVNTYVIDFFVCIGPSMEPTIQSHDIVITEHITQRFGILQRGDLVVARSPLNPTTFICKRIVAKAGDLVHDEFMNIIKIPRGYVWLEGDNQQDSVDSRRYGPVPEALIRSKLFIRLWPLTRFGRINDFRRLARPGEDIEDPASYNFQWLK